MVKDSIKFLIDTMLKTWDPQEDFRLSMKSNNGDEEIVKLEKEIEKKSSSSSNCLFC